MCQHALRTRLLFHRIRERERGVGASLCVHAKERRDWGEKAGVEVEGRTVLLAGDFDIVTTSFPIFNNAG